MCARIYGSEVSLEYTTYQSQVFKTNRKSLTGHDITKYGSTYYRDDTGLPALCPYIHYGSDPTFDIFCVVKKPMYTKNSKNSKVGLDLVSFQNSSSSSCSV